MQEYKITGDKLSELNKLMDEGYKLLEVNTYMGYAEIILNHSEDDWDQVTIIMETV